MQTEKANQRRICLMSVTLADKMMKTNLRAVSVSCRQSPALRFEHHCSNVELGISGQHRLAVVTNPRFRYKFYNHGEGFLLIESIYILALSHGSHLLTHGTSII